MKSIFERKEIKYIITKRQHDELLEELLAGYMQPDRYGLTRICNIYFDTPNSRLIRESLEKPVYKEKLRLRTYGEPDDDSLAFVELKKKYMGVVYKRREIIPYREAMDFLVKREKPANMTHILEEIDWVLDFYEGLAPSMVLCYDRQAYFGTEDPELRMTFDTRIDFRIKDLDLTHGSAGRRIMDENSYVLELKITDAMPLWLSEIFDRLKIFPGSFSKYGTAYTTLLSEYLGENV